jgi:hypothetical protein
VGNWQSGKGQLFGSIFETVIILFKNHEATFTLKTIQRFLSYTVEKANLNCRASVSFLLPCQEGQPN